MLHRPAAPLALIAAFLGSALWLRGADKPTNPPTSQPTSKAATSQPIDPLQKRVDILVRELGAADFKRRERAWKLLKQIGEPAIPRLVPHFSHENPEVRQRVGVLLQRPRDAKIRVQAGVALITSGNPPWIEKGVYFIFEDPLTDYPLLLEEHKSLTGIDRAVIEPVLEQLERWKKQTEIHLRNQARYREQGKEEAAVKMEKMHKESLFYQAEAAYWMARESYEELHGTELEATSKPVESD